MIDAFQTVSDVTRSVTYHLFINNLSPFFSVYMYVLSIHISFYNIKYLLSVVYPKVSAGCGPVDGSPNSANQSSASLCAFYVQDTGKKNGALIPPWL